MIIKEIHYSKKYLKKIKKLSREIIDLVIKKERVFRKNPLHSSLRLH